MLNILLNILLFFFLTGGKDQSFIMHIRGCHSHGFWRQGEQGMCIYRERNFKRRSHLPPCPPHLVHIIVQLLWWELSSWSTPPSKFFLGSCGVGNQSFFLSLSGLDGLQLKIICMSQWHTLGWPALGSYSSLLWNFPESFTLKIEVINVPFHWLGLGQSSWVMMQACSQS